MKVYQPPCMVTADMLSWIASIHSTLDSLKTSQVSPPVESLVNALQGEMSRCELMAELGLSDRKPFRERYLLPALKAGLIEMTLPDKPNSRLQKYRRIVESEKKYSFPRSSVGMHTEENNG